jgi:hypothetical protein
VCAGLDAGGVTRLFSIYDDEPEALQSFPDAVPA